VGAWRAVYGQALRAMFGLGRPLKAKAVPALVCTMAVLPALALVTASSASGGQLPVRYGPLIGGQALIYALFVAAQVPEVISRDLQHRLLPLLFTRDVTPASYAMARLVAIFTAVWVVSLAPLLVLYLGEIGIAKDPAATITVMGTRIGPVLAQSTLTALSMTGVAAAMAGWTARRAFATAAIFGTFLLLVAISLGLDDLAGVPVRLAELLDPLRALRTTALMLFGDTTRGMTQEPPSPIGVYVAVAAAHAVLGTLVLRWRIRRLSV
jgi:ABC-2 type transport system permease protein